MKLDTYQEEKCPEDIFFLVDKLQFKYQALLPGSSKGTYNFRIHHTPRPQEYSALRTRAGLPPKPLRLGTKPSTKPSLTYCCTITFTPSSKTIDGEEVKEELAPVCDLNSSCVDGVDIKVEPDSTDGNPNQVVDVSSSVSDSHQDDKNGETNLNVQPAHASPTMPRRNHKPVITFEPTPVAFGRIVWDCS